MTDDIIKRLRDAIAAIDDAESTDDHQAALEAYRRATAPYLMHEVIDRLDAAERDAARYRWLRKAREHWDILHRDDEDSNFVDLHGNDLDAAIDAAREAEK